MKSSQSYMYLYQSLISIVSFEKCSLVLGIFNNFIRKWFLSQKCCKLFFQIYYACYLLLKYAQKEYQELIIF